ncbi:hypothetical protein GQ53DRAFT_746579 [Thozetella sp. PMI_491]|nr:hypothetical protein GQ53DRAFT_746579 [Thozetella sp. PMI_491]
MCCLVFTCFENLRFNHRGAITHLRSGVQIIESSFDVGYLFSPAGSGHDRPPLCRDVSNDELRGIINYFRHLEICERLFAYDVPLTLAPRLYTRSRHDDGSSLPEAFFSLDEAHKARLDLTNDVMARDYETRNHRGDAAFWATPEIMLQHSCLISRANAMSATYLAFLAGPHAPKPETREYASSQLDMLQIKCMESVIAMMPLRSRDCNESNISVTLLEGTLFYAEKLYDTRMAFTKNAYIPLDFTAETGIVAPLYFSLVYATDPEHKARIMRLLSSCTAREGPWDGRSLAKLIQRSCEASVLAEKTSSTVDPLRRWGGNMDCSGLFSALEVTSW